MKQHLKYLSHWQKYKSLTTNLLGEAVDQQTLSDTVCGNIKWSNPYDQESEKTPAEAIHCSTTQLSISRDPVE